MNYQWCQSRANYLGSLGCALGNEEVFEGDDHGARNCPDRQDTGERDVPGSGTGEA